MTGHELLQSPPSQLNAAHAKSLTRPTSQKPSPALMATRAAQPVSVEVALATRIRLVQRFSSNVLPAQSTSVVALHSLMSVHVTPLPTYPLLQTQEKDPGASIHVACEAQLFEVDELHSSTLVHVTPLPV